MTSYEVVHEPFHHVLLDGVSLPYFVTPESREEIRSNLKLRPDSDIFVLTYPKCGTTWTQNIVRHLLFAKDVPPYSDMPLNTRLPWLDLLGFPAAELEAWPSPRVFKTHNTPQELESMVLKGNRTAKILYVVRDPRDAAVSLYHHLRSIGTSFSQWTGTAPFEEFYKRCTRDPEVAYYDVWETHVQGWLGLREQYNMLVLRYEEMKEDPRREIRRIAQFLDVEVTPAHLEEVVKKTSLAFMKKDTQCGLAGTDGMSNSVLRKGIVGDWENHFTSPYLKNEAEKLRKMADQIYTKYNI